MSSLRSLIETDSISARSRPESAQGAARRCLGVVVGRTVVIGCEQLTVQGQTTLEAQGLELEQRSLQLASTGADELIERLVDAVEALLHRLDLVDVLAPLGAERAEQLEDLVARLLDHVVVERLADHAEE